MQDIKDYVFYILLKNDDLNESLGNSYGVKRGYSKDHNSYFQSFIGIDPYITEDIEPSYDWNTTLSMLAKLGNVVIANTAVEIEDLSDRWYLIYLPSIPSIYQLNNLETVLEEFKSYNIEVGVYGDLEEYFITLRRKKDFDCQKFLKDYIDYYKRKLTENNKIYYKSNKIYKKVMSK